MVKIEARIDHQANREEVKRLLGPAAYPKGPYLYAILRDREMAEILCVMLNALAGVHARVVELSDGNGAA
ncbi:MAG TPA: hypothetical protein VKX49_26145 [Bryobacteraceae bacterium]|nr:hypothetical protein [Bryobacteraceae bacterium]